MKSLGKKSMVILLSLILLISSVGVAYAETDSSGIDIETTLKAVITDIKIKLNGNEVLDKTILIDGKSYLPVREISELLKVGVTYDEQNRIIEIIDNQEVYNYVGSVKLVYSNGTVYEGSYKNGLFNGEGTLTYSDGSIYDGNFINGVIEGKGKYIAPNGDTYTGQFVNNDYYGHGKYTYINGDVVEGTFEGINIKDYASIDLSGEDEKKQIYGYKWTTPIKSMNFINKSFDLTKYNGTVELIYSNGDQYKGSTTNGLYNGDGSLIYQDGSTYKGNWIMNKKSGKGTFTYSDGSEYKGYFKEDNYNGYGKFCYANGDIYDGNWLNGKRENFGKYIEANGNYFYGIWANDVKDTLKEHDDDDYKGYGTYVINKKNTGNNKTVTYKQKWSNGELKSKRRDN